MRLGANLFDLLRMNLATRGPLLAGKLDFGGAINIDPSCEDERAVVFTCALLLAAAVCDRIRSNDRSAQQAPTRLYIDRGNGWEKLSAHAVLTQIENGKSVLNHAIFPPERVVAVPLQPEAL